MSVIRLQSGGLSCVMCVKSSIVFPLVCTVTDTLSTMLSQRCDCLKHQHPFYRKKRFDFYKLIQSCELDIVLTVRNDCWQHQKIAPVCSSNQTSSHRTEEKTAAATNASEAPKQIKTNPSVLLDYSTHDPHSAAAFGPFVAPRYRSLESARIRPVPSPFHQTPHSFPQPCPQRHSQ